MNEVVKVAVPVLSSVDAAQVGRAVEEIDLADARAIGAVLVGDHGGEGHGHWPRVERADAVSVVVVAKSEIGQDLADAVGLAGLRCSPAWRDRPGSTRRRRA